MSLDLLFLMKHDNNENNGIFWYYQATESQQEYNLEENMEVFYSKDMSKPFLLQGQIFRIEERNILKPV